MQTHPVSRDRNFTIGLEFGGWPEQRHVVRYAGEFVSAHRFRSSAIVAAVGEHQRRMGAPIITEQTA